MSWFSKLRNAFHPRRLDDELRDEMSDHIQRRSASLRETGLNPGDAQHEASRRFGNLTQLREQSREIRLSAILETTLQDIRYAIRGVGKSPGFAATAILSLALAIAANTAIYSIVDAALLRPLPLPEPERLIALATPDTLQPGATSSGERDSFSYPLYEQLRDASGGSARLAVLIRPDRSEGQFQDEPVEKVVQQFASGETFAILGVAPAAGSLLSSEEDRGLGGHPVAVISYDYWRRRFHNDPSVIGQTIKLGGRPFRITGVTREGFSGIEPGKFVDIWVPTTMFDPGVFTNPSANLFRIVGRLSPGATREQLQARLQPAFHDHQALIVRETPLPPAIQQQFLSMALRVGAIGASEFRKSFGRALWIMLGVSLGILLIACANVASLLLARSTARASEIAMRVSLGASRSRLVRQLLTESLLLSGVAGVLGWALANLSAPGLIAMLSRENDPVRFALAMDTRVLLFCAAVCTISALLFGLLPALQAADGRSMSTLRHTSGQAGRLRLGRLFVSVQVAFSFCLIVAGAGFLFSLHNLFSVDTGFDPKGVSVLSVNNHLNPKQDAMLLMQQLQDRVSALPNVQSATTAWWAIFEGSRRAQRIVLPGKPPSEREEIFYRVSPGYFATLCTPLLEGRDLDARDRETAPVPTVVNRAFARKYFGGESPLGQEFLRDDGMRHRIVGVSANSYYGDLRGGPQPIAYFPMKPTGRFTLYVRSTLSLGSITQMVEREGNALGMGTRVGQITTLDTLIGNTLLKERLLAGIGGAFAFLGLVLAAIGLFGLLNYSVARRTQELGIRAALGARPPALVLLVLKDLFGMIAGGLLVGLAGSLALMTFLRSLLFGVRPLDPLVMTTAAAIFLAAAFIAGGVPASRAASIDPMVALRHD